MSETDAQPRDEATGQFTINTEGMVGRELTNAEAGFKTRPRDEPANGDGMTHEGRDAIADAASDLAARRRENPAPLELSAVEFRNETIGKPDPKEAGTARQQAQDLASARAVVQTFADGLSKQDFANQIDKARGEALKNNPKAAEELGLSSEDIKAAKEAADDGVVTDPAKPDSADVAFEGLDPKVAKVAKAFQDPDVRQAAEELFAATDAAQQRHAAAVSHANSYAQASLVDAIPELAQVPIESWEAALSLLHQNGDDRVGRAMNIIQRVSDMSAAQQRLDQHKAWQEQQQLFASTEREDARLVEAIGEDAANAANKATLSFLTDHGIPRHEAFQFIQKHPLMATAAAREVIWKAEQYDKMKDTAKNLRAKPLPPVQRPSIGGQSAASEGRGRLASLQAQLANASGARAAKIAGQIRQLRSR
jgi:hypothetical protein